MDFDVKRFFLIFWLWFKKYATKKTVRGELGKPNGFPARRQAQSERKTSLAYFLDYYQFF
ncbi:hypothetical protein DQF64_02260 [Moraxella bovis]|nr:hypothetical protein DQF64_02260 [Moraxella bovis]